MKKRILTAALAVFMLISATAPASLAASTLQRAVNYDLSEMNTVDLDGNAYTSDIFSKYQLTILNCWATWCKPCLGEMPHFQKMFELCEDMGVNMIGVLVEDEKSTVAGGKNIIAEKALTYTNLRMDSVLGNLYRTTAMGIPDTYLVNSKGIVVAAVSGAFMTYDELERWLFTYYVYPELESITINSAVEIGTNRMAQLEYVLAPKYARAMDIEWISSNPDIASVNENGLVQGNSEGTAVITAKALSEGGRTLTSDCEVKVTESAALEDGTVYFKKTDELRPGFTYAVAAHVKDGYYLMSTEKTATEKCRLAGTRVAAEDIMLNDCGTGELEAEFLNVADDNLWLFETDGVGGYIVSNQRTGDYLSAVRYSGTYRLTVKPEFDMTWNIEDGTLKAATEKLITKNRAYLAYSTEDGFSAAFDIIDPDGDPFIEITYYERVVVGAEQPADDPVYGDVNGNGYVDAADATLILRHVTGASSLTDEQAELADMNENGRVDCGDAGLVLRLAI